MRFFCALLLVGTIAAPISASAATATTSSRLDTSVRGVCLRVVELESAFAGRMSEAGRIYAASADTRIARLRAQADQREIEDTDTRRITDQKFKNYVQTLRKNAAGDAAKEAAIDAFYAAVMSATAARRASVTVAQEAFAEGAQALIVLRAKEVSDGASQFKRDMSAAFAEAKGECGAGKDPKEVRETLHASLSAINQKYTNRLADQHIFIDGLRDLTAARTTSLRLAAATFSASLDSASQALHTVLQ